jgi:hypothetical protein
MTPRGIGVWIVVVRGLMPSAQGAMATDAFSSKPVPVRYAFSAGTQDCVGQQHRFDRQPLTSGVPRSTDIPGDVGMSQGAQRTSQAWPDMEEAAN